MLTQQSRPQRANFRKILFVSFFALSVFFSPAQKGWHAGLNAGISLPIYGYNAVLKDGWLLGAEGKYHFKNGRLALGPEVDFVRLQKDKDPNDAFENARMSLGVLLLTADYEFNKNSKLRPFVSGGLGITFFNLNYDTGATTGETVNNVSFTLSPAVGLRYQLSEKTFLFIKDKLVLITDGPPQGFPEGEKSAGYNAIAAGIIFRF